jgi:hypothetical protein
MGIGSLHGTLHAITSVQPHLPGGAAVLVGAAALGAATLPGISQVTQHVNTMAHEGAHAAVGSALGQKVTGVSLRGNGEGRTTMAASGAAGYIVAGVVGYLGPSAFGLGAAKLIEVGHAIAVLWLALAALALLAVAARRSGFGLAAVAVLATGLFLVVRYAPIGAEVAVAYGIAWYLLLSGVQVVLSHGRDAGDAFALRQLTRVPRGMWAALWLAGSVAALIVGARLLI